MYQFSVHVLTKKKATSFIFNYVDITANIGMRIESIVQ